LPSDGTGIVHQSGSIALIRARLIRALTASVLLAGTLALGGCYGSEESYQLPTHAMKELSPQMLALLEKKGMPKDSPILVRIFKEESELEVWKQDSGGRYALLKVYPICRWSGDLGPKVHEGDRQAPEGFYSITPDLMNPNSNYYLAINTGFPNAFDKANGRSGALLMIHGDCSSRGCYAMTDEQIGEIYSLAREAFLGGQKSFQIQAYPFRMTPINLAHHRTNPNMAFWRMIKEGNDHFEVTHLEPKVEVCNRHYVFDPQQPAGSNKSLVFNPTGRCPSYTVAAEIAGPAGDKERTDEAQYAQLVRTVPVAPVRTGYDGGMNRVFLAQVGGSLPPARTPAGTVPPQPGPALTFDNDGEPTLAGRMLGGLLTGKPGGDAPQQVAATGSTAQDHGSGGFFGNLFSSNSEQPTSAAPPPATTAAIEPPKAKPAPHADSTAVAAAKPKPAEPRKPAEQRQEAAAKPKPAPQQEASAAPRPTNMTMNGAQPAMPSGSFDSRWGGLQ